MPDKKDFEEKICLDQVDAEVWRALTEDVEPLPGKAYVKGRPSEKQNKKNVLHDSYEIVVPSKVEKKEEKKRSGDGIDKRTLQRLERGKRPVEGRLDLHGLNQGQAHKALDIFISQSYEAGKRCVLVITGKGKKKASGANWWDAEPGVLRQKVPEWLAMESLSGMVLRAVHARPQDGGDGALYVLLRRKRL